MLRFPYAVTASAAILVACHVPAQATLLDAAVWFERPVGEGVVWRYYHFDNLFGARQSVSYMEIDLTNPAVELKINYRNSYVGPSPGVDHPDFPRARTSVLAKEIPGARGAINGTYFNTATNDPVGQPWGGGVTFLKANGTVIHTFDNGSQHNAQQGILFNDRTDVTINRRTQLWINEAPNWANMMVCGPPLITNGVIETYAPTYTHATARHPRTAVGIDQARETLIFLTVDGRTSMAAGMSCTELAQTMQALGCYNALNLDGGGSTTLWAAGEPAFNGVVNYPSDNGAYDRGGERGAANILAVVSNAPTPLAWDGRISTVSYDTLTRTGNALPVTVTVTNVGSQTWTPSTVSVVPSRPFGRSSAFVPTGQENSFAVMSPSSVPPGQTATFILNLVAPTVATNTLMEENFALWHATEGYFGPADSEMRVTTTVRPPLSGAPPLMIIQGTPSGPNNQWYEETAGSWANSSVFFHGNITGVNNSGTQRYVGAGTLNRSARFRPIFDVSGRYRVDIAFPHSTNNINSVRYTVNHLNGSTSSFINQNSSSVAQNWVTLGEFEFSDNFTTKDAGVHTVVVDNPTVTGNRFYSGAVRFDYVAPLASVTDWMNY